MRLHRGDIVLVPFPFTDFSSKKVRPALIISSDPQNEDIVFTFISSVIPPNISHYDYLLKLSHPNFLIAGLKTTSIFKTRKILTINRLQILRYLGYLTPDIQSEIDERLALSLGLK